MTRLRSQTIAKVLVITLASAFMFGCASFPGNELPKYSYDQLTVPQQKVAIDFDARFVSFGKENAGGVKFFQDRIEKVFAKSQVFAGSSAAVGSAPYHLSLTLENSGNLGGAMITGFLSGLTFTVLPGYAKDEYLLKVDVKQGDTLLKQYQYRDHMETWVELFMIFGMPSHLPKDTAGEVIDNMLLHLVADLQKDGILKPQVAMSLGAN